jgi:hypothetical protein
MSARTADLPIPQIGERAAATSPDEEAEVISYRDVNDVRLNQKLSLATLVQSFLLVISFGVIVYLATRPPQQVIIERVGENDKVIAINGRAVQNGVETGVDKPGQRAKKEIAREWAAARYGIDPKTRDRDIERMFRMMERNFAKGYAGLMKQQGVLERETSEHWQGVWQPQVVEIDKSNPNRVNILGKWEITKNGAQGRQTEVKQLMFAVCLIDDTDQARAKRNAYTGFLVSDIRDLRELPASAAPASVLSSSAAQ